jgi:hypothetical protein
MKFIGLLMHPFALASTEIFPLNAAPVTFPGAAYGIIFPTPLNPNPIAILSLVQLKFEPATLETIKLAGLTAVPGQTEISV